MTRSSPESKNGPIIFAPFAPKIPERPAITITETNFDGISYIAPSWEQMGILTFELAKKIRSSDKKFDRVVALAKGGWTWTRTLVDYLGMDKIASVQIRFYTGIGETASSPEMVQLLSVPVNRERILIFDEVVDSGGTLEKAKSYLLECGAASVDSAALVYKPRSIVKPEYYSLETSAWVIFPHEIREAIELVGRSWAKKGYAMETISSRLASLGLPTDQVEYFLNQDTLNR